MYAFNLSSTYCPIYLLETRIGQTSENQTVTISYSFAVGFLHFLFFLLYHTFHIPLSVILNTASSRNAISIKNRFWLLPDWRNPKMFCLVVYWFVDRSNVASRFDIIAITKCFSLAFVAYLLPCTHTLTHAYIVKFVQMDLHSICMHYLFNYHCYIIIS